MNDLSQRQWLYPFFAALVLFYAGWLLCVVVGGHWPDVVRHWPVAAAMAAGSYVAGSTPMGGGTVGFPVLVLLLDLPATLGRDFSLAIQSVGMTSASIYILCRRQPLEWPMLRAALPGALLGMPLGILFVAPLASDLFIKMLFASMWCSFGLLHLWRTREISSYEGMTPHDVAFDHRVGFAVGLLGSMTMASITGVGIDMLIYMVLVLWCHADLKIAIPTSVILMAFTSLVGIGTKLLWGDVQPGTWENWLAAAPVVAVGAPFGAMIVARVGRRATLYVVSLLCVAQYAWTLHHERSSLSGWMVAASVIGVAAFLLVFQDMYRHGVSLARRSRVADRSAAGDPNVKGTSQ